MATDSAKDSPAFTDLVRPVWRRKWLVLAIVAVSVAGTYFASARHPALYKTSTQVYVGASQVNALLNGGQIGGDDRSTADRAALLLSKPVSDAVAKKLKLRFTPVVSATPVPGTDFIIVTAESGSAAEAAAVANAYVAAYIRIANELLAKQAADAIGRIQAQLVAANGNADQRAALLALIRQLRVAQTTSQSSAQQTTPAVAPAAPFAPRPKHDALFALAISLVLAVALAFALERFDRRIKDIDDATAVYGLPLLCVVPHASSPTEVHEGIAVVPQALTEPLRSLRTNLQLASLDTPLRRIVVASATSGEGKSTIARNLALTYREFGLNVVVVEADLRRPTLRASFGCSQGPDGLTSVLTGDCDLLDALVEVSVDSPSVDYLDRGSGDEVTGRARSGWATKTDAGMLALLPSGPAPPNPQAVLAANSMWEVIEQLSERFDIVIIDTPPLLMVSDALPLLSQSDGVILVARMGVTERQDARSAVIAAMRDPRVRVLGLVANDLVATPRGFGYGYGYGYGANGSGS